MFSVIRPVVALVRQALARVRDVLTLARDPVTLIGRPLAGAQGTLLLLNDQLALVKQLAALLVRLGPVRLQLRGPAGDLGAAAVGISPFSVIAALAPVRRLVAWGALARHYLQWPSWMGAIKAM
ncbi:MAG: hypothetical protein ABSG43_27855 [Solirubrobacteraceae bacterium]